MAADDLLYEPIKPEEPKPNQSKAFREAIKKIRRALLRKNIVRPD